MSQRRLMNKCIGPSVALTETRSRVEGARPLYPSQPLQIVRETDEEETDELLSNSDHTFPYVTGQPSQATGTVIISNKWPDSEDGAVDDGPADDFFTRDEEIELSLPLPPPGGRSAQSLEHPPSIHRTSLSSSPAPSLSRTFSRVSLASMLSTDTFLKRDEALVDPTIPFRTLLATIKRHRSLQEARIVRVNSYRNGGPARHRFIIFQLERERREEIWLRLDRRRDKRRGLLNFALNAGASLANDRAWFSEDILMLSEGLNPEHTISFDNAAPTLGDLRWVFDAIVQVLERYKLLKANCWFLVSFIYECLDEVFHGSTVARFLYLRNGSEEVRRRIRTTSRLVITFPFEEPPSYLIERYSGTRYFYRAMLNHHIDATDDTATSLVLLLSNLQRAFPDWLPWQPFVSISRQNPFDKIPRYLEKAASQLARLLDGGKLTRDAHRFHDAFELFLLESSRRTPFSVDLTPPERAHLPAFTCLKIMDKELRFNMCKLPSSFLLNKDVAGLNKRLEANVSSSLLQACCHWADEVAGLETLDANLLWMLNRFFQTHFLHWLEVMSILALSPVATLKNLSTAHILSYSEELADTIKGARDFVDIFEFPILESIAHIYIGVLAFKPLSSKLFSTRDVPSLQRLFGLYLPDLFSVGPLSTKSGTLRANRLHITTCLAIMAKELRFDLFTLPSSFMRNKDVQDLKALSEANMSSRLRYACCHWSDQVSGIETVDAELAEMLSGFFRTHFLYWLEVMSILALSPVAVLKNLNAAHISRSSEDLADMIKDAQRFVEIFEVPILESVPHIYISVLAFTPLSSRLCSDLRRSLGQTAVARSGALSNWLAASPIIHPSPRGHVLSLAFSPDGRFLVSGSSNRTLQLWDPATGDPVGETLSGHEDSVRSVAFSPDGTRIASGSDDQTIRLWDVATQRQIGQPLRGHTGVVWSVAFSPDGTQLVSGSSDSTVCRWNTRTGRMIGARLQGHSDDVNSVTFSPDSTRIASASDDKTIWIWDAETGKPIGKPMEGHSALVWWVAFAPDGIQIASASADWTVRRWDARTGEPIDKPSEGHAGPVYCVAFLPDGGWIASGSRDKTVRLWNAHTGEAVSGSLKGHSDWVRTVAFSPDGSTLASGADDGTILLRKCSAGGSDNEPRPPLPRLPNNQSSRPHQNANMLHPSSLTSQHSPSSNLPPRETLQLKKDGWITGPKNELILWLPLGLRDKMPFSEWAGIDNIDFSNFKCGTEWTDCWRGSGAGAHIA